MLSVSLNMSLGKRKYDVERNDLASLEEGVTTFTSS